MRSSLGGWLLIWAGSAVAAGLPRSSAPADARVYFISPRDGDIVTGPVSIQFGLKGMGIAPADERHLHFGKGQTEAIVTLAPGQHRLQLLLALPRHDPGITGHVGKRVVVTGDEGVVPQPKVEHAIEAVGFVDEALHGVD